MGRFYHDRPVHPLRKIYISLGIFAIICGVFWLGFSSLSHRAEEEQQKTLEEALHRGITQCYAIEGRYPESLEYLSREYGISYDEEAYFVDYRIVGSNIMPDITVIKRD